MSHSEDSESPLVKTIRPLLIIVGVLGAFFWYLQRSATIDLCDYAHFESDRSGLLEYVRRYKHELTGKRVYEFWEKGLADNNGDVWVHQRVFCVFHPESGRKYPEITTDPYWENRKHDQ